MRKKCPIEIFFDSPILQCQLTNSVFIKNHGINKSYEEILLIVNFQSLKLEQDLGHDEGKRICECF